MYENRFNNDYLNNFEMKIMLLLQIYKNNEILINNLIKIFYILYSKMNFF